MIDPNAMFTLSYGLFVLTTRDRRGHDCGCIVNTVTQLTETPMRIAVSVNKQNYTDEALRQSGILNVSVLDERAPMEVIRRFGFQSGRNVEKFAAYDDPVSENGLRYLQGVCSGLISATVESVIDCGTHTLYIALVTHAEKLSDTPSMTYRYYFENVKPKKTAQTPRRGYVCKICGYFHEGDELPDDFICPWCKHGASDFEPVGF